MTAIPHRLPGVRFLAAPPSEGEVLPRMDITAFVGLAASGPMHTPVPIEDVASFHDLFGGELPLAWDAERGRVVHAYLAPAVEAFFRAGGRRCFVVRVAGDAATTRFPLPHLVAAGDLSAAPPSEADLATAEARSAGSWADGLRVATQLHRRTLPLAPSASPAFAAGAQSYLVEISAAAGDARRGDLLEVVFGDGEFSLLLLVEQVTPGERSSGLTGTEGYWLQTDSDGQLGWRADTAGLSPAASLQAIGPGAGSPAVRRLNLELLVWRGDELVQRLANLGFSPDHPRFWGFLPSDDELYPSRYGRQAATPAPELESLFQDARDRRFALAGPSNEAARRTLYLPLGMATAPDPSRALAARFNPASTALERDGLAAFGPELFLDPDLAPLSSHTLMAEAEHKHSILGQRLLGLHSLLGISEVTLLALPDAVQRNWRRAEPSDFPVTAPEPAEEDTEVPADFANCEPTPTEASDAGDSAPPPPLLPGRAWLTYSREEFDETMLIALHRATLRFCAARGDLLTLLSLPSHYREEQAAGHVGTLQPGVRVASGLVPPLGHGEEAVLSYGALYHPWVVERRQGEATYHQLRPHAVVADAIRRTPPDGVLCGILADVTLERGAWMTPANRPLTSALALEPTFGRVTESRLIEGRMNVLRQDPRGFLTLSASTLSDRGEVRSIAVRRVLILLRRLALAEGRRFVFEPQDEDFRRRVRHRFEQVLTELFERGALAGGSPDEAFRVVIEDSKLARRSMEQGQLIVELRVAPARPLAFLTVRLVQAGPELLTVQES